MKLQTIQIIPMQNQRFKNLNKEIHLQELLKWIKKETRNW